MTVIEPAPGAPVLCWVAAAEACCHGVRGRGSGSRSPNTFAATRGAAALCEISSGIFGVGGVNIDVASDGLGRAEAHGC